MAAVIEVKYDPQAVSVGMRKAAEEIRKTAAVTDALGKASVASGKGVYMLAQDTYKLADSGKAAQKEVFSLRKTIDEMTAKAPAGMKRMTEEMKRFREETAKAKEEARQVAGAQQYGHGGGFKGGGGGKGGGYSGGAVAGAGLGGAAAGAAVTGLVGRGLGLDAIGMSSEAITSMFPTLTRLAPMLVKTSVAGFALYKTFESIVTITGELKKVVHDTVNETEFLAPKILSIGEFLGSFASGTRGGLEAARQELEMMGRMRLANRVRPMDNDEQQQQFIEQHNSEAARRKRYWERTELEKDLAKARIETEKRVRSEILSGERDLLRDRKILEESLERSREQMAQDRLRRAQMEADRLVAIEKARDDRIKANQEKRAQARELLGESGGVGDIVRKAFSVDPDAVKQSTNQRRKMLTEDAETYNRFLRDEEREQADADLEKRFGGMSRRDDGSFVIPSQQREYNRARAASLAKISRNERQRNQASRREIAQEMRGPEEQNRAQAEVAQTIIDEAASRGGASQAEQQLLTTAINELRALQAANIQQEAFNKRMQALLEQSSGARKKAQRSGRN